MIYALQLYLHFLFALLLGPFWLSRRRALDMTNVEYLLFAEYSWMLCVIQGERREVIASSHFLVRRAFIALFLLSRVWFKELVRL